MQPPQAEFRYSLLATVSLTQTACVSRQPLLHYAFRLGSARTSYQELWKTVKIFFQNLR